MSVASLAMYPLPTLRDATDTLWRTVRTHLGRGPELLDWTMLTPDVWHHPELLLGQTCGWPLVTLLADSVLVVGTFDYDVPQSHDGTYRSVLVTPHDLSLDELRERDDTVVAVNGYESLSGWVSLQHAWGSRPAHVVETGGHLKSVCALRAGSADVASVDPVTWQLLADADAGQLAGLRIVGHGPRVPCLPLVTGLRCAADVPALRAALAAAVADPATADARRQLRIRAFLARDLADYLPLRALLA